MKNYEIIFSAPCEAEFLQTQVTPPGVGQVQVKISVSTISSGTERANLMGDPNVGWNIAPQVKFPRKTGYSSAGIVTAVGEGVTDLKPGDRVALSWSMHRRYINMPRKNVFLLPESVSFRDAAMFHIGTFPLAAIRKCRLELGESAVVMGLGVLGMVAVQLLKAAGAAPIIAVDPVGEKRQKALAWGADYALDPMAEDFSQQVKAITAGGAKVGIEVTGIGAGLDGILDCMAPFGRVALLGCTRDKEFTIDYYRKVHGPGITLIGAHTNARPKEESHGGWWTQADDMQALIRLHALDRLHLGGLVEQVASPLEAPEIYNSLIREKNFPVVQFDWEALT